MLNATSEVKAVSAICSRRRRAERDLAQQVAALRLAVEQHSYELESLLFGTSHCSTDAMMVDEFKLFEEEELAACIDSAKKGSEKLLNAELKRARELGATRRLAKAPSVASLTRLERDFPHFAPVIEVMRERTALASLTPGRIFSLPPLLLAGPPGVGKTAFSEMVAEVIGVPTRRVDMGSTTASFVLGGSHSSWASARPGAVWSLLQDPVGAGLMLVDELDKASEGNYPPTGPLYRLLEPSSAKTFSDEYTELKVDASHIIWIATCNDTGAIEPALLSRFVVFEIPCPTEAQMIPIAQSVYRKCRNDSKWGSMFPQELSADVAAALTKCTPRELTRLIDAAAARAAMNHRLSLSPSDILQAREAQQLSRPTRPKLGFV